MLSKLLNKENEKYKPKKFNFPHNKDQLLFVYSRNIETMIPMCRNKMISFSFSHSWNLVPLVECFDSAQNLLEFSSKMELNYNFKEVF